MYGTPVIGANIGGIPDLIENGKTGLLFESANADDLAEKVTTLWNNRSLLEEMTENCSKIEFDTIDVYGKKVIDLFKQLIANNAS